MNRISQKTVIIVLCVLIAAALAALGIIWGISRSKPHTEQTAEIGIAEETTAEAVETTTTSTTALTTDKAAEAVSATTEQQTEPVTVTAEDAAPVTEAPEPPEVVQETVTVIEYVYVPVPEPQPADPPATEPPPQTEPPHPVIRSAEIVGTYNDYGAGYMFRLDLDGDYDYWTAEVTETCPDVPYTHTIRSSDLTPDNPYLTGGSCMTDLRAVVTPYFYNGDAGEPVLVVWDQNRTEHQ